MCDVSVKAIKTTTAHSTFKPRYLISSFVYISFACLCTIADTH